MPHQGARGKDPTTDAPQRPTTASSSGCMGPYHQSPVSLLLPAVFLCRCIKLSEIWSTLLGVGGSPQAMIRLMETIFRTHRPTWDDIIQLLVSLFSPEERHRILTEARKWFRETAPEGTAKLRQWAELATLDERPDWTVTQRKGGTTWRYRVTILQGLKGGGLKSYVYHKALQSDSKGKRISL